MRFHLFAATAIVAVALSTDKITQGMQHGDHGPMHAAADTIDAPFDLQFIDTMIAHHRNAIEIAQLADKQAVHEELQQLAKKIIDDRQKEIGQLQAWKQEWYPGKGDATNMMMPRMQYSMSGISTSELQVHSGDAFDAAFIDMMIRHHQAAIAMARDAARRGQHKEIRKLSRNIARAQSKEIDTMTKWKKEWKPAAK